MAERQGAANGDPHLPRQRTLVKPTAEGHTGAVSGDTEGWLVYVLVSRSGERTYVGISTKPDRRLAQHNGLRVGGARATRAGRPWTVGAVYGPFGSRAEAQRAESAVKKLRGRERLAVLAFEF